MYVVIIKEQGRRTPPWSLHFSNPKTSAQDLIFKAFCLTINCPRSSYNFTHHCLLDSIVDRQPLSLPLHHKILLSISSILDDTCNETRSASVEKINPSVTCSLSATNSSNDGVLRNNNRLGPNRIIYLVYY